MKTDFRCLVVEDSPMMRQMLMLALGRVGGVQVVEAEDGVDALRKIALGPFDIILTDINMPIMDGLKLVRRVRMNPTYKDTPIVVITTEAAEEDRKRAMDLGATAYITKPIQATRVVDLVRELLHIQV
jgi:two-component system, chemotaxis family, chemotaxis protein CheY